MHIVPKSSTTDNKWLVEKDVHKFLRISNNKCTHKDINTRFKDKPYNHCKLLLVLLD